MIILEKNKVGKLALQLSTLIIKLCGTGMGTDQRASGMKQPRSRPKPTQKCGASKKEHCRQGACVCVCVCKMDVK